MQGKDEERDGSPLNRAPTRRLCESNVQLEMGGKRSRGQHRKPLVGSSNQASWPGIGVATRTAASSL